VDRARNCFCDARADRARNWRRLNLPQRAKRPKRWHHEDRKFVVKDFANS
jgi:hypothetical protein